jgi:hypothetical protein
MTACSKQILALAGSLERVAVLTASEEGGALDLRPWSSTARRPLSRRPTQRLIVWWDPGCDGALAAQLSTGQRTM